jgi:hypothetical protein
VLLTPAQERALDSEYEEAVANEDAAVQCTPPRAVTANKSSSRSVDSDRAYMEDSVAQSLTVTQACSWCWHVSSCHRRALGSCTGWCMRFAPMHRAASLCPPPGYQR